MDKSDLVDLRASVSRMIYDLGTHRGRLNSELNTNVELAYRHLEDASMRLGRAIQAIDSSAEVEE